MMRTVALLLVAVVLAGCGGASPAAIATATASPDPTVSRPPPASTAGTFPLPPMQGQTPAGAEFAALANVLNASMAALSEPERTLEQVTAGYAMQSEIMSRFVDGLLKIDWPPLVRAEAWKFVTLALGVEFYDAALSRAPSMAVVTSLEASRDGVLTGWQAAVDALGRDLVAGAPDPPTAP